MNLISDIEPMKKRFNSGNDCESKSNEERNESNIQESLTKNVFDEKTVFPKEMNKEESNEKLLDSDNEALEIIDSDDALFTFPPDSDVSDMLEEVQYSGYFPTITERYFTSYYKVNMQLFGNDICIRIHSNRICMLSLAPSHIVLQGNKVIKKVNFKVSDKLDRALNKVSGKGKHGAQPLQTNSNICTIICSDEQSYLIKCGMIGKLVEVNEKLSENPQLLKEPPHKGGYLAIILPNIKLLDRLKQSLLTQEQYTSFIKEQQHEIKNDM